MNSLTIANFEEHYELKEQLGTGSYSIVHHAIHRITGEPVAVKIIDKTKLSGTDQTALHQEIDLLTKVQPHPNILQLYHVIEDKARCYLITEYMKDGDLFDTIVKRKKLPEPEAQRIVACLMSAIEQCHGLHILHRDVKPENILLDGNQVKLCDFGFSVQLNSPNAKLTETCGTPGYAAPELLNGKPYNAKIDIFSLGIVIYILLCGYPPFPMKLSKIKRQLPPLRFPPKEWLSISASAKELISHMLDPNPIHRPTIHQLQQHHWIQQGSTQFKQMDARKREQLEQMKQLLRLGMYVTKYGRNGLPHITKIRLNREHIEWDSKYSKRAFNLTGAPAISKIQLKDVRQITKGHGTKVFERYTATVNAQYCFSLITEKRTLDLAMKSIQERDFAVETFQQLVLESKNSPMPSSTMMGVAA